MSDPFEQKEKLMNVQFDKAAKVTKERLLLSSLTEDHLRALVDDDDVEDSVHRIFDEVFERPLLAPGSARGEDNVRMPDDFAHSSTLAIPEFFPEDQSRRTKLNTNAVPK